jgi:hypothetical protein
MGLLSAVLVALYPALMRWLRTPLLDRPRPDKSNRRDGAGTDRASLARSTRQSASVHAFSR